MIHDGALTLLLRVVLCHPLCARDQEQERAPEPERDASVDLSTRYKETPLPLGALRGEPWNGQLGLREFVCQLGRFEEAQAGESLELMALRLDVDPTLLMLTNSLPAGHVFTEEETVCVELRHLLLPDESLKDLAELHECSVETLRGLNGLDVDAWPEPWSMLKVPVRYGGAAVRNRGILGRIEPTPTTSRTVQVIYPRVDDVVHHDAGIRLESGRLFNHVVAEGDTWESIGEAYGVGADELKFAQHFLRRSVSLDTNRPQLGTRVAVFATFELDPEASLTEVALSVQYHCWRFPQVLRINGLERAEEVIERSRLRLPLNLTTMQFSQLNEEDE